MGQIVIFSKSECPHCIDAKEILNGLAIPFKEINIEEDLKNSMLMSHASKRHTVPQIFFNDQHIGGASELKQISADDVIKMAEEALGEANEPAFLGSELSEEELRNAIIPIKDLLDPYLPENFVHMTEYRAVEIWYSQMFGFLCNCYDQMTLKPEPMSLFIPVLSSMMDEAGKEVGPDFGIACMATAYAAGCAYCAAHGADLTMKYAGKSDQQIKQLYDYLNGDIELQDLPFSDELKVIVMLSAGMSTQTISQHDMALAHSVVGIERLRSLCESIAGMGAIMGFLNRYNDLIGVEIEASIKQTIDNSALAGDWDWGTHDTEDEENHHVFKEKIAAGQEPPSAEQFRQLCGKVSDDVFAERESVIAKYLKYDQALLPKWIAMLPNEDTTRSTVAFYHACLNEGDLSSELKHLACYAMLSGAGYPDLAAEEKRIAASACSDDASFDQRLSEIDKVAAGEEVEGDTLTAQEIVGIKLARQAQTFPHVVRGELVVQLAKQFTPAQIVELVMALAVNGIGQRTAGINKPFNAYLQGVHGEFAIQSAVGN
jgi:glutaredoxin 3